MELCNWLSVTFLGGIIMWPSQLVISIGYKYLTVWSGKYVLIS